MERINELRLAWLVVLCCLLSLAPVNADEAEQAHVALVAEGEAEPLEDAIDFSPAERPRLPDPVGAVLLVPPTEPDRVWVDKKKRSVIVDGYVTLQEGYLEMFACIAGTKEHEAVVSLESRAFLMHTGLLAVGAKPGKTAIYLPELRPVLAFDFFFSDIATAYSTPQFFPPTGTEIEVTVHWLDREGVWQQARAQDWVIDGNTDKPMTQPWVFAGSGFWKDEQTGKEHYLAESGDVICVSNFSTAMLDVPIESSQQNDGLIFTANPKKVPPLGTPIRLVLTPKFVQEQGSDSEANN
ncbi:MAG: YdjY domain-containing protein [Lacipirellulaceae bacterium]